MLFLILEAGRQETPASTSKTAPALWVFKVKCLSSGEIQEFVGKDYKQVTALMARTEKPIKAVKAA